MISPILVLGRTGQFAQCLIEAAQARATPLVAAGRPDCDVRDRDSIERLVDRTQPRAVINAAAYTAVDKAEAHADDAFAVNETGAANVAAAAAAARVPCLSISTDYVFDGRASSPYRETDAAAPVNVYGRSKRAGEIALREANPAAFVVRTSWLYSGYGHNFVRAMLALATRDVVRVVDDQRGGPTSAHDLAAALFDMVDRILAAESAPPPGVYHASASGETTWFGFAQRLFDSWRSRGHRIPRLEPISTAQYGAPAPRPRYSVLDCRKLARSFGIGLPRWDVALERCLERIAERQNESAG